MPAEATRQRTGRPGWSLLGGAVVLAAAACSDSTSRLTQLPYTQDFASPLGAEWSPSSGGWQVVDGNLFNDGAHNVPLWLRASLPSDVRVTFEAESKSPAVDIKFEIFGDGQRHESGYIIILGGWNNSRSIIARRAEHGERHDGVRTPAQTAALRREVAADAVAAARAHRDRRDLVQRQGKLESKRVYRLRFDKRGHELHFFVDDVLHLEYFDPSPLDGRGNDRFAFNNWASPVHFDNLTIEPL